MELKYKRCSNLATILGVLIVPLWNWNKIPPRRFAPALSSNRTFMELKYVKSTVRRKWRGVLIVPLWNWNTRYWTFVCFKMLVLIVPLWNWNRQKYEALKTRQSSNRTFMELKLKWARSRRPLPAVLIVPLWNWNKHTSASSRTLSLVLIVPLWNWNELRNLCSRRTLCSNRTFMELK